MRRKLSGEVCTAQPQAQSCTCLLPACPPMSLPLPRPGWGPSKAPFPFRRLEGDFQKPKLLPEGQGALSTRLPHRKALSG